jgi:hypothetical protein
MESHKKKEREVMEDLATCTFCEKSFSNKYNCRRHMEYFCPKKENLQNVIPNLQNVIPNLQNVIPNLQNVIPNLQNVIPNLQNVIPDVENVEVSDASNHESSELCCSKCKKVFSSQYTLKRHEPICKENENNLQCPFCKKTFTKCSNKSRHVAVCKEKYMALATATTNVSHSTQNIQNNFQNSTINNTMVNNNDHSQNITMNININNLGQEKIDHISPEMLNDFLRQINGNGVASLIHQIHFDPKIPENNNVRIDSLKGQTLMVYEDDQWHIKDMNAIIQLLVSNGCRMLFNHYDTCDEIKNEDQNNHHNVMLRSLLEVQTRQPNVFYPTRRKIIASMRNLEHQKHNSDKPVIGGS